MDYRSLIFTNTEEGKVELVDIGNNIPKFSSKINIGIDGSSTCTGISYIDANTAAILGTTACMRGKDASGKKQEDFVEYKVRLKQFLKRLIDENLSLIAYVDYEEPFIGYVDSSKVLMSIRTSVKELKIENEPAYDVFKYTEINNMKWKKLWLEPEKVPAGTELQKETIKNKLVGAIGEMAKCTQDEIDATCMEYVATKYRQDMNDDDGLKTHKTVKPFKYNIVIVGVEEGGSVGEQVLIEEIGDITKQNKVPARVLENGMKLVELNGHGLFDKHVYSNMGEDDKLLILGFDNGKYVNVIIENNVAWMLDNFSKLYAIIWRKSRKQ